MPCSLPDIQVDDEEQSLPAVGVVTKVVEQIACDFGFRFGHEAFEGRIIAEAIAQMQLQHAVITSVDRDDLPDFGAYIFAEELRTGAASFAE